MNEEEIIEEAEKLIDNCDCWLDDDNTEEAQRGFFEKEKQTIQGLLDLYNKEKEKNNALMRDEYDKWASEQIQEYHDLSSELNTKCINLEYELQQEKEKNKKLEDVIDMMLIDISNSDIDEDICRRYATKEKRCAEGNNQEECVKCIREYYFKKARGEENG